MAWGQDGTGQTPDEAKSGKLVPIFQAALAAWKICTRSFDQYDLPGSFREDVGRREHWPRLYHKLAQKGLKWYAGSVCVSIVAAQWP